VEWGQALRHPHLDVVATVQQGVGGSRAGSAVLGEGAVHAVLARLTSAAKCFQPWGVSLVTSLHVAMRVRTSAR